MTTTTTAVAVGFGVLVGSGVSLGFRVGDGSGVADIVPGNGIKAGDIAEIGSGVTTEGKTPVVCAMSVGVFVALVSSG